MTKAIVYHLGNSDQKLMQELRGRTDIKVVEEHCLTSQGLLNLLFSTHQDNMPKAFTTHNGMGSPTSIVNQENALQICLQANQTGIFLIEVPLPR